MGYYSTASRLFLVLVSLVLLPGCISTTVVGGYQLIYASPETEMRLSEGLRVVPVTLHEANTHDMNHPVMKWPNFCLHEVLHKPETCLLIGATENKEDEYVFFIREHQIVDNTDGVYEGLLVDPDYRYDGNAEWEAVFDSAREGIGSDIVVSLGPYQGGEMLLEIYTEEDNSWNEYYVSKDNLDISHYKRSYLKQGALLVATPFAIALDVVTFPLQAAFIVWALWDVRFQ